MHVRRLRYRQRGRPEVLRRVRQRARARLPGVRQREHARSQVLRRVRRRARRAAARAGRRARRPAAERRLVSVLFADLVGFTAASESRDAEDMRELLSRYFETCRRLIDAATAARSRSSSATP